jgi:hypothetical protein
VKESSHDVSAILAALAAAALLANASAWGQVQSIFEFCFHFLLSF